MKRNKTYDYIYVHYIFPLFMTAISIKLMLHQFHVIAKFSIY